MSGRRDDPLGNLVMALILGCIALAGIVLWFTVTHPCRAGHYETRFVPGHIEQVSGYQVALGEKSSDRLTFTPVWIPDHNENVWLCEEPSPDRHFCRGRATVQLGQTAAR